MNKFIELTNTETMRREIINTDLIRRIEIPPDGDGILIQNKHYKEPYDEVKAMLEADTIVPIAAEIVGQALEAWQDEPCSDCSICKYYSNTTGRCEAKYIADYINRKLGGQK